MNESRPWRSGIRAWVWWGGLGNEQAGGRAAVWSGVLSVGEWVIGGRLFCQLSRWDGSFCWRKEGRFLFTSRERKRETRGEGKCGRWLRATNHMVTEEGGRNYSSEHVESHTAITGLTACFPHGCCSAAMQPLSLPQAPTKHWSALLFRQPRKNKAKMECRVSQGSNSHRSTGGFFFHFLIKWFYQSRVPASQGTLGRHKAQKWELLLFLTLFFFIKAWIQSESAESLGFYPHIWPASVTWSCCVCTTNACRNVAPLSYKAVNFNRGWDEHVLSLCSKCHSVRRKMCNTVAPDSPQL